MALQKQVNQDNAKHQSTFHDVKQSISEVQTELKTVHDKVKIQANSGGGEGGAAAAEMMVV